MKYKSVAPRSLPTPCMFRMYKYIYSPSAVFGSRAHAYMKLAIASQRLTMSTAHTLRALHWRRRGACTPGSIYSSTASGRSPHGHRLESKAFFVWSPHGHRTVTAWKSKRFQRCDKRACVCFQLLYSSERENAFFSKR